MMSQWVKTLVPQWGIEPWSLIIWEGSEPLEHQDVITFTPKRKHVLKLSEKYFCPGVPHWLSNVHSGLKH